MSEADYAAGMAAGRAAERETWQDVLSNVITRAKAEERERLRNLPTREMLAELLGGTGVPPWRYREGVPPKMIQ